MNVSLEQSFKDLDSGLTALGPYPIRKTNTSEDSLLDADGFLTLLLKDMTK